MVALTLLVGCSKPLKDKLAGTWKIDTASIKSAALTQPGVGDLIKKQVSELAFEFRPDGTFSLKQGGRSFSGKWSLNGTQLTYTFDDLAIQSAIGNALKFEPSEDGSKIHFTQSGSSPVEADLIKSS
jgi:hypothetical protein